MKVSLGVVFAMAPAMALAQEPLSLNLVCKGRLAVMEHQTTSGRVSNPYDATESANVETSSWRVEHVDARLSVILQGEAGRVRPDWGSFLGKKGVDGWYPIDALGVAEDTISGRVAMGLVSRPKLKIDRRTGDVRFGDFKGVCEKSTLAPDEKKF